MTDHSPETPSTNEHPDPAGKHPEDAVAEFLPTPATGRSGRLASGAEPAPAPAPRAE